MLIAQLSGGDLRGTTRTRNLWTSALMTEKLMVS